MKIEQQLPNKPNFALIGVLTIVSMLVIFVAVVAVIHYRGRKLEPHVATPSTQSALRVQAHQLPV